MATFTTRSIIDRLIAGNGWETPDDHDAPDNPQAVRIVEYDTPEGETCWGVVFPGDADPLRYERPTQFVRNPRLLWAAATEATDAVPDEPMPWDLPSVEAIHLSASVVVRRTTPIRVETLGTEPVSEALSIEGGGYSRLSIYFGFTDEDQVAVVDRLVEALQDVRSRSLARLAAEPEAVPA